MIGAINRLGTFIGVMWNRLFLEGIPGTPEILVANSTFYETLSKTSEFNETLSNDSDFNETLSMESIFEE